MSPRTEYRIYEMLPGIAVWATIIGSIILSFTMPLVAAVFIIIFDTYWLFRVLYFVVNLVIAWREFRRVSRNDWRSKMHEIVGWQRKVHVVMLPTFRENRSVVFGTLSELQQGYYPSKKMLVVLAGEERDKDNFLRIADAAKKEFDGVFRDILVTIHPQDLPGELPGKGSNLHFAGPFVKEYADTHGLLYSDVIVSAFDIDTLAHPHFFCYLTYVYCTSPRPTRTSFQPVPLYHNNLWNASSIARIMAFGTTFWMLSELTRPQRLWTFSSHCMSLQALVDVGYWQKNIVSEDSRIFLQSFMRYDGDYTVTPMYLPVSMDTVASDTWWKSLKNVYLQQRRWAWGVENFPFMVWHFRRNHHIPHRVKWRMMFNYAEGMFSWAMVSLLILILGRVPLYVGRYDYNASSLFQNTPFILESLMQYAMVGLVISAGLSFTLLPARPKHIHASHYFYLTINWLLLPVTLLVLGSFPAIDAQTRLMTGKYLGFNVTPKTR